MQFLFLIGSRGHRRSSFSRSSSSRSILNRRVETRFSSRTGFNSMKRMQNLRLRRITSGNSLSRRPSLFDSGSMVVGALPPFLLLDYIWPTKNSLNSSGLGALKKSSVYAKSGL